jgi:hypothetical protein
LLRKRRYPIEPHRKSLSVALDELRLGAEAIGPATWPPQIRATSAPFPEWYLSKSEPGALMRQIISSVYGALLISIWICVMGIVVAVLDSGEPKWLLVAAGFVAATITVTLVQELIEWRSRPTKSALERRSI